MYNVKLTGQRVGEKSIRLRFFFEREAEPFYQGLTRRVPKEDRDRQDDNWERTPFSEARHALGEKLGGSVVYQAGFEVWNYLRGAALKEIRTTDNEVLLGGINFVVPDHDDDWADEVVRGPQAHSLPNWVKRPQKD